MFLLEIQIEVESNTDIEIEIEFDSTIEDCEIEIIFINKHSCPVWTVEESLSLTRD